MKKERKSRFKDHPQRDAYHLSEDDTRAYGLITHHGNNKGRWVKIDPKAFQKENNIKFTEEQLRVINERHTHYFRPQKDKREDYYCNWFVDIIESIIADWNNSFKKLIDVAVNEIKKPYIVSPGDYDNLQMGISGPIAAQVWAEQHNYKIQSEYRNKVFKEVHGLYAQFLQQAASRIEAVTVRVLVHSNAIKDGKFDRKVLYATAVGKSCSVEDLPSFKYYDELYCLWHFIKHNSKSTYDKLHERYPQTLSEHNKYSQGALAIYFINFSEEMILEILNGCIQFFKEYCNLVFNEDYDQAQWNYNQYFLDIVNTTIENVTNPWGFDWYDDID